MDARTDMSTLLTLDDPDTDVDTQAWRSLQPKGVVNKKLPPAAVPPAGRRQA